MSTVRSLALGLGLAVLLAAVGTAPAADPNKKADKAKGGPLAALEQLTKLVPADAEEKLKLTDDQKKQVAKLQEEYQAKTKDGVQTAKDEFAKAKDAIKKAREDKDKAALQKAAEPIRDKVEGVLKTRKEYDGKVRDLLTDEQKKTSTSWRRTGLPSGSCSAAPRRSLRTSSKC